MSNWCTKCGDCCKEMLFPFNPTPDATKWLNLHEKTDVIIINGKPWIRIKLSCTKLEDNKCTIYKDRPDQCRNYNEGECKYFYGKKT